MPQPEIVRAMEKYRRALLQRERAAATRLVNAYGDIYKRLLPRIDALGAELDAMRARDEDVPQWKVDRLVRQRQLRDQIEQEIARFAAVAENTINEGARQAIDAASADAKAMVQAALPGILPEIDAAIMGTWNRLPREAVETLLGFLSEDAPLTQMMRNEYPPEVAKSFAQKMVEGLALGKNPRVVARQALGVGLTWALRTARTAHVYAYREAARANYVANSHVVTGWIWRSAREPGRTCMSCIAMDGTVHGLDETLNDHDNGRCFPEPMTVSYRDLGIDVDVPTPTVESGQEWFEKQSEATQREMLGAAKYRAWKAGAITLDDMTAMSEHPVWGEIRSEASLKEILGDDAVDYYHEESE